MKGFKDKSGKFHPHTQYKGTRKSRDQSTKTQGIRLKRDKMTREEAEDLVLNDISSDSRGAYPYEGTKEWDMMFERRVKAKMREGQDLVHAESLYRGQNIKVKGHGNSWKLIVDGNIIARADSKDKIFEIFDKINRHPEEGASHALNPRNPRMSRDDSDRFGNPMGTKYNIVRFFSDGRRNKVIHRNVSDVVAQLHTNDPRTRKEGVYFDGFRRVT